ncbi:RraA family protein [Veillonella sp. R32]|uniref:RraA family protein n=1 Tax=Veillonella sp. R32 TaxID=2021312 RepID=UPI0013894F57|nr:RraA family protein [Veillonella sp. R32]KAF1682055.1 methyltransferase [Veillonella sp. R32]
MAIGNRVYLQRPSVNYEVIKAFEEIPAANIADSMGRLCALHPRISLKSNPDKLITAGRALTVKTRSGDNLMIHKALNMAEAGDVIVVSNDTGCDYRSLMGEIMFRVAEHKNIAGIVLDGPLRDIAIVKDMKISIYATGSNPGGPYKSGTGEINTPISCGGISVNPGDVVVMDADGVIIIPFQDAELVLQEAIKFQAFDSQKVKDAIEGKAKRGWVDEKLNEQNTEIIDSSYF